MITLRAPAKINLFLHVTGKQEDGYHLLDSLVVFAPEIADIVEVEKAASLSLEFSGPFGERLKSDSGENLVLKAAGKYAQATGIPVSCTVRLEKNIPMGAGLGGGSADAAATILALENLYESPLPLAVRQDLLLSLGADVPVCYESVPLRFQGIGEKISAVPDLPQIHMLLVWPGKHVGTKEVFEQRAGNLGKGNITMPDSFGGFAHFIDFLKTTGNDLTVAAETICPDIRTARGFMLSQEGCILERMSGSGSCVFGIFENAAQCAAAQARAAAEYPHWWAENTVL